MTFILLFLLFYIQKLFAGYLDTNELNVLYDIKLTEQNALYDFTESISLTSKYGNKFTCAIPKIEYPIFYTKKSAKQFLKNITKALQPLKKTCLNKTEGWWTYEFCYKKKIIQYHLQDGRKRGMESIIGHFNRDYNWESLIDKSKMYEEPLPHIQFYTNGTFCAETKKPRETEVRYICSRTKTNIDSVLEHDCTYVITINTPLLCAHPYFNASHVGKTYKIHCEIIEKPSLRNKEKFLNETTTFQNMTENQVSDIKSSSIRDTTELGIIKKKHAFRVELKDANIDTLNFLLRKVLKSEEDNELKRVHNLQNLYFKNHDNAAQSKTKKSPKDLIIFKRL